MGGIVIQFGILLSSLIMAFFTSSIDWYTFIMVLVYGLIGFLDDYLKIKKKHNEGLTVIQKLLLQVVSALFFTIWAYTHSVIGTVMIVPFFGTVDFGIWYIPITFIAIVAITNATNLTDGLDGLCAGCSAIVMVFFLVCSMIFDEIDVVVFSAAFIGACLGFLVFNFNPAKIFMGDTGSLALGAGLVSIAIRTHLELYFLIAGFIFVLEALSVVIQVGYFKLSHGKRVFRMAPIHHHFELGGLPETKVVVDFWIYSILLVFIAFFIFSL